MQRVSPRAHAAVLGALLLGGALIALFWLGHSSRHLAWTNSVGPRAEIATLGPHQRMCAARLWMPAGADAVRVELGAKAGPSALAQLELATPMGVRRASAAVVGSRVRGVDLPVGPIARSGPARACVSGTGVTVAGTPGFGPDKHELTIDGKPFGARITVAFLEPRERSLFATLSDGARRAALFKPAWVGPWTYAALAALALAACALGMAALLRGRGLVLLGLAVALNALGWGLITPAFQGPDEDSHYAYAEYLGETGSLPERNTIVGRSDVSADQFLALRAVRHNALTQFPQVRPPWRGADEAAWRAQIQRTHPSRSDGGGATGATLHGPVYYALPALAARVGGGDAFDRLWAMRLASALLGALTALLAALTIAEIAAALRGGANERRTHGTLAEGPRVGLSRLELGWPAMAAGLLVGFEPMFGFVSGTVNPDVGANLAGAALLYLGARALGRGLTPAVAIGLIATFVLGALAKETMLGFAPVVAFPFLWHLRRRPAIVAAIVLAGVIVVVAAVKTGAVPVPESSPFSGQIGLRATASWLWQLFLPPLPFMTDLYNGHGVVPAWSIYVERTWGAFGWLSIVFPQWVYGICAGVMAGVLGLAAHAGLRERPALRAIAPQVGMLALALVCVAATIHLSFISARPTASALEQGRYLFPAITAAAALAIAACFGLGRRLAPLAGTALTGAMMLFSLAGMLLVFAGYYT